MAFRVEQKVGNTIYVYNAVNYWDKEKKQSRQRKTIIGKRDTETNEIIPTGKNRKKVKVQDFGCTNFLEQIYGKIGITEDIKNVFSCFPEILTLISFLLSESKPVYLAKDWLEA
ncbi:MAG: hypothetical protein U9R21_03470, partial [Candidatus Thermoplasmatota archaeon]|nr:hypothetical protein [Candidatus Thermoplasmatota archaeon]